MLKWIRIVLTMFPIVFPKNHRMRKYRKEGDKYPLEKRWTDVTKMMRKANKFSLKAVFYEEGKEDLPKGQVFFASNHTSDADPVLSYLFMDRPVGFLAKKEILSMPFIGNVAGSTDTVFIDRKDLRSEVKAFKEIDTRLKNNPNLSYFVFPEGTRAKAPNFELGEFHSGTFRIAIRRKMPIVPVALWLPERVLDQNYHYHKYPVQIHYLKPLYPEVYENMTSQEIATYCHDAIAKELPLMKEKDREYVKALNHYSDKKLEKVLIAQKTSRKRS